MNIKKLLSIGTLTSIAVAAICLVLARNGLVILAIIMLVLRDFMHAYSNDDDDLLTSVLPRAGWLITGISLCLLIALTANLAVQIGLAVLIAAWRLFLYPPAGTDQRLAIIACAIAQALAVTAIFTAEAFWHWPGIVVLVLIWLVSYAIARNVMIAVNEKNYTVLAAGWALIACEVSWVLTLWMVSYIMPGGVLIIPQATILIMSMAYCYGSIYLAHRAGRLSRARLAEYAIIGIGLLLVVISGTKWNGSI